MFEPAEKRPFDSQDSPLPVIHDRESRVGLALGVAFAALVMAAAAFGVDRLASLFNLRVLR